MLSDPEEEKRLLLQKYSNVSQRALPPVTNKTLQDFLDDEPIETPRQIAVQQREPEPPKESPQMLMFKGVKRSYPINFTINLDTHIPRLDFIEMMEDSYEYSIIDWLSEDITNQIFSDRERVKSDIKEQIKGALEIKSGVVKTTQSTSSEPSVKKRAPRTKTTAK